MRQRTKCLCHEVDRMCFYRKCARNRSSWEVGCEDRGQAGVLGLSVLLVLLAVAGLVFDGSRALLYRRHLQAALDAALLAGATEVDRTAWDREGGVAVRLDPGRAHRTAVEVFSDLAPPGSKAAFRAGPHRVAGTAEGELGTVFLVLLGTERLGARVVGSASPLIVDPG